MFSSDPISRREFLAASAGFAVVGDLALAQAQQDSAPPSGQLALHGGEKAVKQSAKQPIRWGEPERERLDAMLGQDSLFYWKGPQTTLLLERFKKVCPVKYVMPCSSGTAALHIAVAAAGIGPGDEVITSPITDIGTVIGVIYQQGVPVFADLGASTYSKQETPEAEAILRTGIKVTIHEAMTEDYVTSVAEAIWKVARHYAA